MLKQTSDIQKPVLKAAMFYTISNIVLRGVSLFTAPIFTRLLSTSDYGIASNFMSWSSIVMCVTGLSLGTSALRGKIEFKDKYKEFLSSIQTLGILTVIVVAVIMICTIDFWTDLMQMNRVYIILMMAYLLVYPSVGFAQVDLRFDYRYKENVLIAVINTFGSVLFSISLILLLTEQKALARIIGTIAPTLVLGTIFLIRIYHQGKCYVNRAYWRYALQISLPMIPHSLAMLILGQIDRTMIIKYCGESEAGIYSFGYSYGILLSVVTNAVNDAIQPVIYEYLEQKQEKKINEILNAICSVYTIVAVAAIGGGPEALRILGTEEFYAGRWVVYPVIIGTMFQFFYQNVSCIEIYYKKTKLIAVGSLSAAVVNLVLNAVFIPRYGFVAAGYTTLIGYFLLFIYHCFGAYSITHKNIISNKIWIITGIIPILFGGILTVFYDMWFIRYLLLFTYLIVAIIFKRKEIQEMFSILRKKRSRS